MDTEYTQAVEPCACKGACKDAGIRDRLIAASGRVSLLAEQRDTVLLSVANDTAAMRDCARLLREAAGVIGKLTDSVNSLRKVADTLTAERGKCMCCGEPMDVHCEDCRDHACENCRKPLKPEDRRLVSYDGEIEPNLYFCPECVTAAQLEADSEASHLKEKRT